MCLYSTSARIFCACCNRLFNCFLMAVLRCDEVRKSPNSGHLCERKQNDQSSQTCGTSFTKTYRCKLLCYCSFSVTCLTGKALQLLKKVRVWRFRENTRAYAKWTCLVLCLQPVCRCCHLECSWTLCLQSSDVPCYDDYFSCILKHLFCSLFPCRVARTFF